MSKSRPGAHRAKKLPLQRRLTATLVAASIAPVAAAGGWKLVVPDSRPATVAAHAEAPSARVISPPKTSAQRVSRLRRRVPAGPIPDPAEARLADATDIPLRALTAYEHAAADERATEPGCHLDWQYLAAFGRLETNHGRLNGSVIGPDGLDRPAELGPPLDGSRPGVIGALADTTGTPVRAAGPLQFIPASWQEWGRGDPQNIDEASAAAARYLCADAHDLSTDSARYATALTYNHVDWYATDILAIYHDYCAGSPANFFPANPGQ